MAGRFLIVSIRTAMGVFEEKFSQSYFYSFPAGLLKEVKVKPPGSSCPWEGKDACRHQMGIRVYI